MTVVNVAFLPSPASAALQPAAGRQAGRRRNRVSARQDSGNPARDLAADGLRVIFLQVVRAGAQLHQLAIGQTLGELFREECQATLRRRLAQPAGKPINRPVPVRNPAVAFVMKSDCVLFDVATMSKV
ncbi:MAG: hypothetical protein J0H01_22510 [Rhizobiales bacterium]|nr:hypothetical protein [Hyphomicrobiales bacterium]